jgi:hypothetical protein
VLGLKIVNLGRDHKSGAKKRNQESNLCPKSKRSPTEDRFRGQSTAKRRSRQGDESIVSFHRLTILSPSTPENCREKAESQTQCPRGPYVDGARTETEQNRHKNSTTFLNVGGKVNPAAKSEPIVPPVNQSGARVKSQRDQKCEESSGDAKYMS